VVLVAVLKRWELAELGVQLMVVYRDFESRISWLLQW